MLLWQIELSHHTLSEQSPPTSDPSQPSSSGGTPQDGDLVIRSTPPSWQKKVLSFFVRDPRGRTLAFVVLVMGVVLIANHGHIDSGTETEPAASDEAASVPGHLSDPAPEAPHTPEGEVYRTCLRDRLLHRSLDCSRYLSSRAQVHVPNTQYIALHGHALQPGEDLPALLAFHGQNVQIVSVPSASQIPLDCAVPACHKMTGDVDVLFGDIGEHDQLDLKIQADHGDVQTALVRASDGHAGRGPPAAGERTLQAATEITVVYIVGRIGNIAGPPHMRGDSRMSAQLEDFGQTLEGLKTKVNERPGWTDLVAKGQELRQREGIERRASKEGVDDQEKPPEHVAEPVIHPER